jgi:hypothetical protein
MIATLIPANSCCSNSIIYIKNFNQTNQLVMEQDELLYLLGVFNSFIFDYLLRLKVSQNLNMFIIRDMPLPKDPRNKLKREIIKIVKAIYSTIPDLLMEIQIDGNEFLEYSDQERRALLDARVAVAYCITFEELEYILDQFHIRDNRKEIELDEQKGIILDFFSKDNQ